MNDQPNLHRGVLIVKGKAGLGNRMLAALTGVLYARLAGRDCVVDWRDFTYSDDGSNAFPHYFQSDCVPMTEQIAASTSINPAIWAGHLDESANDMLDRLDPDKHSHPMISRKYSADLSRIDHNEDVLVMWCFSHQIGRLRRHFKGPFERYAAMSDREVLGDLLRNDMRLHPDIEQHVDAFAREHFGPATIGVHVRFMDRKSNVGQFTRHIDRLTRQRPDAVVLLCTDNPDVERHFRERYDKIIMTQKWMPAGGASLHQNPECPSRLQNGVEALIDMYLLARCDYLVYPGSSTFSQISSLVSSMPAAHVIDIERFDLIKRLKKAVKAVAGV